MPPTDPPPPAEGVDYYVENGCWVFTAAYHLRRGACCGSGCRHCPYDGVRGTTVPDRRPTAPDPLP
jgi:hypothetical protein